jgi:hypothetical protein
MDIGTEIKLFTIEPNIPTHKIKFLTDEKETIRKIYVYVNKNHLHNLDVTSIALHLYNQLLDAKKIKTSNQVYQFIQSKISEKFVTNFEIVHLKIHPILQVTKGGVNFVRFDDEIKDEYIMKPKERLQKMLDEEAKAKHGTNKKD